MACPASVEIPRRLNLGLVRKYKKPTREARPKKDPRDVFSGGSAADLLSSKVHPRAAIEEAVREGRLRQVMEERQLQNSLPYFNKDGRYASVPGPNFATR